MLLEVKNKNNFSRYRTASLNFIDLRKNSGPAVNEVEFNRWLLGSHSDAVIYTPYATSRICGPEHGRIYAIGGMSIRRPLSFIWRQIFTTVHLCRHLERHAVFYYRHSRLSFAAVILKILRPDIRLIVHRAHPAGSDALLCRSWLSRLVRGGIEIVDRKLRNIIYMQAAWIDCVNSSQARALSIETGRNVHVVANGVNTTLFSSLEDVGNSWRKNVGIPDDAIVIGYCGGFPMARGAQQVRMLIENENNWWGVVVGKITAQERDELNHPRLHILGEIDYSEVPYIISSFDVAVAFDIPDRVASIGNSNQKIRQGLAGGAWILTMNSDIGFDDKPWLGCDVSDLSKQELVSAVKEGIQFLEYRGRRAEFAKNFLDTEVIFERRHAAVMSGN